MTKSDPFLSPALWVAFSQHSTEFYETDTRQMLPFARNKPAMTASSVVEVAGRGKKGLEKLSCPRGEVNN